MDRLRLLLMAGTLLAVPCVPAAASYAAITDGVDATPGTPGDTPEIHVRVAEGDTLYTFTYDENLAFEEGQQLYLNSNGEVTNFTTEALPLLPIEREGGAVFLRNETVQTPGSGYRLEDGQTSLQIDFNF